MPPLPLLLRQDDTVPARFPLPVASVGRKAEASGARPGGASASVGPLQLRLGCKILASEVLFPGLPLCQESLQLESLKAGTGRASALAPGSGQPGRTVTRVSFPNLRFHLAEEAPPPQLLLTVAVSATPSPTFCGCQGKAAAAALGSPGAKRLGKCLHPALSLLGPGEGGEGEEWGGGGRVGFIQACLPKAPGPLLSALDGFSGAQGNNPRELSGSKERLMAGESRFAPHAGGSGLEEDSASGGKEACDQPDAWKGDGVGNPKGLLRDELHPELSPRWSPLGEASLGSLQAAK